MGDFHVNKAVREMNNMLNKGRIDTITRSLNGLSDNEQGKEEAMSIHMRPCKSKKKYKGSMNIEKKAVRVPTETNLASVYLNLSSLYSDMKKYQKATVFCKISIKIIQETVINTANAEDAGILKQLAAAYNNLGILYERMNKRPQALKIYKQAVVLLKTCVDVENLDLYEELNKSYNKIVNLDNSLEKHKNSLSLMSMRASPALPVQSQGEISSPMARSLISSKHTKSVSLLPRRKESSLLLDIRKDLATVQASIFCSPKLYKKVSSVEIAALLRINSKKRGKDAEKVGKGDTPIDADILLNGTTENHNETSSTVLIKAIPKSMQDVTPELLLKSVVAIQSMFRKYRVNSDFFLKKSTEIVERGGRKFGGHYGIITIIQSDRRIAIVDIEGTSISFEISKETGIESVKLRAQH